MNKRGPDGRDNYTDLKISLDDAEKISTQRAEVSKPIGPASLRFFRNMKIHNHYKPYKHLVCYRHYLCVCHGNTISIFNRLTGEWEKHFSFARNQAEDQGELDTLKTPFDFDNANYVVCIFLNRTAEAHEICIYF